MSDIPAPPIDPRLDRVFTETRRLSQALAQTGSLLVQDSGLTSSMRTVLEQLYPDRALTVPDIARARRVTRQHIQTIVNDLLQRELIQTETNPAHKRSPLMRLTPLGQLSFKVILNREQKLLQALAGKVDAARLSQAAETLHELASLLAAGNGDDQPLF